MKRLDHLNITCQVIILFVYYDYSSTTKILSASYMHWAKMNIIYSLLLYVYNQVSFILYPKHINQVNINWDLKSQFWL